MSLAAWIVTAILGLIFATSGALKSSWSRDRLLASGQSGIAPFPMWLIRVVAVSELAAVAGLILPWSLDRVRVLTPLAALGLCVVMYGAAVSHASLREPKQVAGNLALFAAAASLAALRFVQLY